MAVEFNDPIDLNQLEIQNVRLQQLSNDPATPVEGQVWHRGDTKRSKIRSNNINEEIGFKSEIDLKIDKLNPTLEATGFVSPKDVRMSYNGTTRTVTITSGGSAYFRYSDVSFPNGWTSPAHPVGDGSFFLYYNGTTLNWSTTPWKFTDLMIAFVYRNGVNFCIRECHGMNLPADAHTNMHENIGTYLRSGLDISSLVTGSTTADNRRPLISSGIIVDEDIPSDIAAITVKTSYTKFQLSGNTVAPAYTTSGQTDIINLSTNQPFWNQFTGGSWQQTLFTNGQYGKIFIMAVPTTDDAACQVNRLLFIQPQFVTSDLNVINNLETNSLNLGQLATALPEFCFIGEIIVRYLGANWTITSYKKLSGSRLSQTASIGNFLSSVSTTATLSGDGTVSNPLDLANVGTAGTYTKVVTNTKGQVTSGGVLVASDIPAHTNATGSSIGQATSALFGHTKASNATPLMDGTAAVGTDNGLYAREGHVHPTDTSRASSTHTHGNITSDGKIGSTAGLPLLTTTSGVITTGSFGTSAGTFCQGNDSRLALQTITLTGDISGSGTGSFATTLANIGTTGTYTKVTTDTKGRVTSGGTATKVDVGLSAVDNTSDLNKPVSTATQTALNLKANIVSPTFTGTVSGITKVMVGLSAVDNTSDVNKPISTATQNALNLKAALTHTHGNITSAGAIGSTADLPIKTTASGVLNVGAWGTTAGTFCQGNDSRLSDTRTPTDASYYVQGQNSTRVTSASDFNLITAAGFYNGGRSALNTPISDAWFHVIQSNYYGDSNYYGFQLAAGFGTSAAGSSTESYHVRTQNGLTWLPWRKLYHNGEEIVSTFGATVSSVTFANHSNVKLTTSTPGAGYYVLDLAGDGLRPTTNNTHFLGDSTHTWKRADINTLYTERCELINYTGNTLYAAIYGVDVTPNDYNFSFLAHRNGLVNYVNGTTSVVLSHGGSGTALVNRLLADASGVKLYGGINTTSVLKIECNNTGIGFYGVTPVARQAAASTAAVIGSYAAATFGTTWNSTEATRATTMSSKLSEVVSQSNTTTNLVNTMRSQLISLGLLV